ncbi:MAG: hypothetical protein AB2A00_19370 [Myxococcota bacterium]
MEDALLVPVLEPPELDDAADDDVDVPGIPLELVEVPTSPLDELLVPVVDALALDTLLLDEDAAEAELDVEAAPLLEELDALLLEEEPLLVDPELDVVTLPLLEDEALLDELEELSPPLLLLVAESVPPVVEGTQPVPTSAAKNNVDQRDETMPMSAPCLDAGMMRGAARGTQGLGRGLSAPRATPGWQGPPPPRPPRRSHGPA